jgi:hypothetical protein
MRIIFGLLFLMLGTSAFAAGNSAWAVPTRIDVVRNEGVLIYGSFANPAGCTTSDTLFLPISATQYKEMYAMLLTAFASGKQISMYASVCTPLTWYSGPSVTYNTVSGDSFTLQIQN